MKAILLVRVSTQAQDFTEQEKEIYQMAINDGYKPEDIIPICEKESGIKLDEEDRAGLNQMKQYIEAGGINCVYCWEVSRIARRKKINFSVLEYLIQNKVQLIIKNPYITLFNPDGTINEGAETIFTIFSQMAESEMRTKLVRFKRTKDARRKQGYFTGGILRYGYTIDAEKKFIPHPTEAEIVKMMFTMYLTGRYSFRSLAKELQTIGIFTDKSFTTAQTAVKKILTNSAYAGVPSAEGSYTKLKTDGNIYPALVTIEMVEKCKEIAKKNIIEPKKKYSTLYFGKGILRCPICGKVMMAVKARNFYHCKGCATKSIININMVDSALWTVAAPLYRERMLNNDKSQKEYYERQIELLKHKVEVAQNDVAGMDDRANKLYEKIYVDGTIDAKKGQAMLDKINANRTAKLKEISDYNSQINSFNSLLFEVGDYEGELVDEVSNITDDKVRFDIIHQVIRWATIEKLEQSKMLTVIRIYDYMDNEHKYLLDSRNHKIFSKFTKEGIGTEEVVGAYEQRFICSYQAPDRREKYLAYQKQYRESRKNSEESRANNAERQRKYRQRKKATETK